MYLTDVTILNDYNEENDSKKLRDLMNCYDFILGTWIKLLEELNVVESINTCNFVSYLLYNGYFSKDKVLNYQIKNRLNTSDNYAFDIMCGNGVCINFSCFLKDMLQKHNILSSYISLKFCDTKTNYKPNIEMSVINDNNSDINFHSCILRILKNFFNQHDHGSTLVCDDRMLFVYDITNLEYFRIKNLRKIEIIGGGGYHKLNYRFNHETAKIFLENNINNSLNIFLLEELKKYNEYIYPSEEKIINSWENMYDLFCSNISLLNDCYIETKKDIDKIANYVEDEKKIKKLVKNNK